MIVESFIYQEMKLKNQRNSSVKHSELQIEFSFVKFPSEFFNFKIEIEMLQILQFLNEFH
jgi:hypothetical protein